MKKDAIFSWSSGKDSTLTLYKVLNSKELNIVSLITTVTDRYNRVSMHGLRVELLQKQADSLGLPLCLVRIPKDCTNRTYEKRFEECVKRYREENIDTIIFGDIFLENIRKYREERMSAINMHPVFPIWKEDSLALGQSFIDLGFKAKIICIDSEVLEKKYAGMDYDYDFLSSLPENIDPCGENGEFHTFTYDGPLFRSRIEINTGKVVLRDGRFYYCDILPR